MLVVPHRDPWRKYTMLINPDQPEEALPDAMDGFRRALEAADVA
jgi:hypothetical protein